jgi:serine O-acetyltransferase
MAVLGINVNIHKGVTIGQENRGARKGTAIIGNSVWIGVNATIVGNIIIGDDVLIAPNTYVNCDVPNHSIVFGNPCIIKHRENATQGYINNKVDDKVYN